MHSFEGFLDRVHSDGSTIVARIVTGDFDPKPERPPVLLVTVEEPVEVEALYAELLHAKEIDDGCHVALHSGTEAVLTTDHGDEIALRGARVTVEEGQYDENDFERLAKQNHEWGMSQHKALAKESARLRRVRLLLQEQHSRTLVKIQGHEAGTTAHTLYAQHLSFLARVLAEPDA